MQVLEATNLPASESPSVALARDLSLRLRRLFGALNA
jgi:hypothetical protein